MKVLFYDAEKGELEEHEVRAYDYDTYCNMIGADTLDVVLRRFGKTYYQFIIDDEGLLKSDPKISTTSSNMLFSLAGNLIISGYKTPQGEMKSLKRSDVRLIREHLKDFNGRKILMGCDL